MDIIKRFTVTQTDTKILKPCILHNRDDNFKEYGGYHTGVDLLVDGPVYSYMPGKVILCCKYNPQRYTIIIQHTDSQCTQYKNLTDVSVQRYDYLGEGQEIGHASKYVHFEYMNPDKNNWPVRIGLRTFYLHDPESIIHQGLRLNQYDMLLQPFYTGQTRPIIPLDYTEVPPSMVEEFTNSRG